MKKYIGAAILLFVSLNANASFIGTEASCDIEPSGIWGCNTATETVVADSAEFILQLVGQDIFAVDINSSSLQIESIAQNPVSLGAGEFLTLTLAASLFDSLSFNVISQVTGVSADDIAFDGEVFTFDMNQTFWEPEAFVLIDFSSDVVIPMPNVPAALLMLLGLVALRRASRR